MDDLLARKAPLRALPGLGAQTFGITEVDVHDVDGLDLMRRASREDRLPRVQKFGRS